MAHFKVGDRVRARGLNESNTYEGFVVEIQHSCLYVKKKDGSSHWSCKLLPCGNYASANGVWDGKTLLENMSDLPTYAAGGIISSGSIYTGEKITKPTMSLKTIYRNLTRTEPQRTFVKAGVCNDDGSLTTEGRDLFLEYLLKQNGEAFKKDVVDAIAEEKDKECK